MPGGLGKVAWPLPAFWKGCPSRESAAFCPVKSLVEAVGSPLAVCACVCVGGREEEDITLVGYDGRSQATLRGVEVCGQTEGGPGVGNGEI